MVVDTSALLAILFDEELRAWVIDQFEANRALLRMSVVNYAEALIRVGARFPAQLGIVESRLRMSGIRLRPVTVRQAEIAAAAGLGFPLNLGDCFAYALARDEDCPLLTLDRDFGACDIEVVTPRSR